MKKFMSKILLLSLTITLSSCAVINSSDTNITGKQLESATLGKLVLNETSYVGTVALLGAPTTSTIKGKTRTVTYKYLEKSEDKFGIIFIIMSTNNTTTSETTTLVFVNDVLINFFTK